MQPGEHQTLLLEALRVEGEAQRRLLAGDGEAGRRGMRDASARYRASWEVAPPRSFGRLIGMLKAAVIGGNGAREALYARHAVGDEPDSPAAWYALAVAALVQADDALARRAAAQMREATPEFGRAAAAVAALAERDPEAYRDALRAIVADFEGREEHLTGVAIADTALMLDLLADRRGMAVRPSSALVPII